MHDVNWYPRREDGPAIVRCRSGHLFTTVWVPFGSFKALRFGRLRLSAMSRRRALDVRRARETTMSQTASASSLSRWFDGAGP